MPGYKDLWRLLRSTECSFDARWALKVSPSKLDRMLKSKRLWRMIEQDRRIVEIAVQYNASFYVAQLMDKLPRMPDSSPKLRQAFMDLVKLSTKSLLPADGSPAAVVQGRAGHLAKARRGRVSNNSRTRPWNNSRERPSNSRCGRSSNSSGERLASRGRRSASSRGWRQVNSRD